MNSFILLFKNLKLANKGRLLWRKYNKKYGINQNGYYLLLMPTSNREYNYHAMLYIEKCAEPLKKVIILTADKTVKKSAFLFEKKNEIIIENVTREESNWLIRYYALKPFYHRFWLITLDEPSERKCSHLIGKKGITAEELIAIGIMNYDYKKFDRGKRPRKPLYEGKDKDILSFINDDYFLKKGD